MGRMMLGIDNTITFKQDTHQYFDKEKSEYKSVSRVLKTIKVPFDREGISRIMAAGIAKEDGISIDQAQRELLSQWDDKRDSAGDHGDFIHYGIDHYLKSGIVDTGLTEAIDVIRQLVKPFYRYYSEVILYDKATKVAGQTDLVVQRQKTNNSVYDFYDYKTNKERGIQFDSIGRKDLPWKNYNRYFLAPLDYMESCNYNEYSLQLSLYAYLAHVTYGIRVGRLAIIFIDSDMKVALFPVAYLYHEAKILVEHAAKMKQLPGKTVSANLQNVSETILSDNQNDKNW